ncbi:MAG: adenylate/guanylate cyclase domain-containing protein, partial [Rhodospirillaceae bacterium]|nr:adenylate/guanylate cyclase domain-containing protein [Rhodospirillaceae bacterium]
MSEKAQRRLAAIVAADIVGYSRLVGADEEGTLRAFRMHRVELIDPLIGDHGGRIANTAGDSLLLEFASAVDAVRCAVAIQEGMAERNRDTAGDRQIRFRIGINVGDVVAEGDDLLGDGVNIAARLEALSEPGGVGLSDDAYRQVRDRLEMTWEDGGEQELKNIARPVHLWQWSPSGPAAIEPEKSPLEDAAEFTYSMPQKPSIAVLPFDNLSGDPSQDYIGDGLTENIIAVLAGSSDLSVIARNSTFTFKNKAVLVQQVAEQLGVRYVLEGSIQRAGDQLRITAQLIDATDGRHIWAERYDRRLDDLFQVQDDITQQILEAMQIELTLGQQARTWRIRAGDPELFRLFVEGRRYFTTATPEAHLEAHRRFSEAYESAPDNVLSNINMGWSHYQKIMLGIDGGFAENAAMAREFAERALAIEDNAESHAVLGWLELLDGNHQRAIEHADRIMELDPSSGMVVSNAGSFKVSSGQVEEGIALIERSMRLEPYYPEWVANYLAFGHLMIGQFEQAKPIYLAHMASEIDNPYTRISALTGLAVIAMSD